MNEQHISVIPNIAGQTARGGQRKQNQENQRPILTETNLHIQEDPDVRKIMENGGDEFNVHTMQHKKTKEELVSDSVQAKTGTSSWVIIIMAIVVVILICAIVYLVLKYNEPCEQPPDMLLNNLRRKPNVIKSLPPNQYQPPVSNVQKHSESFDKKIHESRPDDGSPLTPHGKGTKDEMLEILKRTKSTPLNTIAENENESDEASMRPKLKSVDKVGSDDQMVNDFYAQMEVDKETDDIADQANSEVKNLISARSRPDQVPSEL